jgi:D-glycero-alpha-D-manno-heptose 1-phosphate guanylyltransferase
MEAIVLAGGLGTRLRSVVQNVPKPMADINGKPFLEYLLEYLYKNQIKKIILSVGYKWQIIKDYFGKSYKDMEIIYSIEDEPLGTGGAVKKALSFVENDEFFLLNGDTFFNIKLNHLDEFMKKNNSHIVISLKQMKNFDRYGVIETDKNGKVTAFKEKEYKKEGNINGGIYLIKKNIFDNFILPKKFSFENFLTENVNNLQIFAKSFDSYFIDIGIPEDYEKAKRYFSEK